ncbi:MAG: hypothetical protein WCY62_03835 [Clostridia bacterium]|jgi:predicted transcriptional regulator of viral defense system
MIKTTAMLLEELHGYKDPFGKIKRLCNEQKIIPVARGVYETNADISGYLFAPVIYGPSYLSFNYALSRHGLIPEAVYEYSSATCCKGKKKTYSNHFGRYSYRDIPDSAFPYETKLMQEDGYVYSIATPEKALCDKLYELNPVRNLSELKDLLFDNMRIDKSEFSKLNADVISELSELYHSNNIRFLAKLMQKENP